AVEVDTQDLATRAQLVVWVLERRRQHDRLRARLGKMLAGEALAKSAEDALLKLEPFGVGVGLAQRRRGLRKRMISETFRPFPEQRAVVRLLHRRGRIFARTRALERISARLDLALEVARLAARPAQIFEAVVMRLELLVGCAPILDGQLGIDKVLAIALL